MVRLAACFLLVSACGFSGHAGRDGGGDDDDDDDAAGVADARDGDAPGPGDAPDANGFVGVTVRINVGGPAYVASDLATWAADVVCDGGVFTSPTPTINGTADSALFADQKYTSPLTCTVPALPAGAYDLTLGFAELYFAGAPCTGPSNTRTFSISIEGAVVAAAYDETGTGGGCAADGGPGHAVLATFPARIDDGQLDLVMTTVTGNYAVLNALQLVQTGP